MSNMPTKEKKADYIKRMCQENNLTVAEVLRKAGASPTLLVAWDKEDPKSIQVYDAIIESVAYLSLERKVIGAYDTLKEMYNPDYMLCSLCQKEPIESIVKNNNLKMFVYASKLIKNSEWYITDDIKPLLESEKLLSEERNNV